MCFLDDINLPMLSSSGCSTQFGTRKLIIQNHVTRIKFNFFVYFLLDFLNDDETKNHQYKEVRKQSKILTLTFINVSVNQQWIPRSIYFIKDVLLKDRPLYKVSGVSEQVKYVQGQVFYGLTFSV